MADVWYRTGVSTCPASGTRVISTPSDPKCIHVWYTHADTNDTNEVGASYGHGFGDGTDALSCCIAAVDGGTTTRRQGAGAIGGTDAIMLILDPANQATPFVVGTTAAMNANDITISFSTFTNGKIFHWEAFGGTDVTANITLILNIAAATNSPWTHGLSSAPDLLMFLTNGQGNWADNSIHSYLAFGVAHDNGASIDQWCLTTYMGDTGIGDGQGSGLTPAICAGQYDIDFADWTNTVTVIGATTYTWTDVTPQADDMAVLAIDLSGIGVDVGTFTKATGGAPVDQDMPDLGFTPQGYHLASANKTVTTRTANTDTGTFHGAVDESNDTGNSLGTVGAAGSEADRNARSNNAEVLFGSDGLDAGVDWSGTHATITDATPTINWNPNTANAVHIGYYAFETQVSGDILATPDLAFAVATADLEARGKLDATPDLVLSATADLKASGKLDATPDLIFSIPTADLNALGKLDATPDMAFSITADLTARGKLDATAAASFAVPNADLRISCDQLLPPDAILVQTNLSGVVGDIDEPVDAPDANWLLLSP